MMGGAYDTMYERKFGTLADLQNQHAERSMMLKGRMKLAQREALKRLPPPPKSTEDFLAFQGPVPTPPPLS